MDKFEINEICIMQNCKVLENDGRECVVIKPLDNYFTRNEDSSVILKKYGYVAKTADGEEWCCAPHQLRRKSPPASTADEREYLALMGRLMNRKEQTA